MARLKDLYKEKIAPELMKRYGYKNIFEVPRIEKIVVNVGMGKMAQQKELVTSIRDELAIITGQRPALAKSKKSISNFKLRAGAPIGYKVTLRKKRMYEFLDKLVNFVIPRIRDFRGVSQTAFDEHGNYTLGVKDQTIFPELELDKLTINHGMDICIVTSSRTKQEALSLLEAFGMPFVKIK